MTVSIDSLDHPNLIAAYTFDDIVGSQLNDELGVNNGTITGASIISGAIHDAIQFSAAGHQVRIPTSAFNLQTFTLSFFINTNDLTNSVVMEVGTNNNGWTVQMAGPISYSGNTTTGCLALVTKSASTGLAGWKTSEVIADTGWRHCMVVKNGTTSIKLYVDTIDRTGASLGRAIGTASFNDNALMIGQRLGGVGPFTGAIDHLKIFDIALGQADAVILSEEASPYIVSGLVTVDGTPLSTQVRLYNAATGALVDTVNSDANGVYEKKLRSNDQLHVVAVPGAGYRPLIHGPINPILRNI